MNCIHYQMCKIITKEDIIINIVEEEWDKKEFEWMQLNNKTRCTLIFALSKNEYKKITS